MIVFLRCVITILILFQGVGAQQCSATDKTATETLDATSELKSLLSPGTNEQAQGSYPSSLDCKWILDSGAADKKILIAFRFYHIEAGPGCSYDSLKLYDGNSVSSPVVATICGTDLSSTTTHTSSGQYFMLAMKSDFSVQYAGFFITYNTGRDDSGTGCTATQEINVTMSDGGHLSSPGYPGSVSSGATCSWLLKPSNNNNNITIQLLFSDIGTGSSDAGCTPANSLSVYEGSDSSGTLLATFCDGRQSFPSTQTTVVGFREVFVTFNSPSSATHGFYLSFNETESGFTTPAPPTTTQAPVVESGCGTTTLTATSTAQFITSPSYPIFYANNLDCSWLIEAPTGFDIQITFLDFFIEESDVCVADILIIYDGDTTEFPAIGRFCGEIYNDVNSTSNKLLLTFTTDQSYTERGFRLSYAIIQHDTPSCVDESVTTINLNASSTIQYFASPGYPSNYASSSKTQWLIYNPTEEGDIIVKVEDSRIEAVKDCVYDKVEVYKGACQTYPLLGRFCGVSKPTYYQDAGRYVLLVFTTDINVEFRGFNISYVIGEAPTSLPLILIIGLIVGPILAILLLIGVICCIVKAYRTYKRKHRFTRIRDGELAGEQPTPQPGSSTSDTAALRLPPMPDVTVKLPPIDSDLLYNTKKMKLPPIPRKSKKHAYSKIKDK